MIEIIKITKDTVRWTEPSDHDGVYTYPRGMFPKDLTMNSKIEYCAGEFLEIGEE